MKTPTIWTEQNQTIAFYHYRHGVSCLNIQIIKNYIKQKEFIIIICNKF
jgi:hypothetical protein